MAKIAMTLFLSQMMLTKNHMAMIIFIVLSTVATTIILFLFTLNQWMSLMIIMLYISGIMVLFMFVVSLTPNEMYKEKNKKSITMVMMVNFMFLSACKHTSNENFKMNTCYKVNFLLIFIMTMVICTTALTPPKILILLFKGMKTSK